MALEGCGEWKWGSTPLGLARTWPRRLARTVQYQCMLQQPNALLYAGAGRRSAVARLSMHSHTSAIAAPAAQPVTRTLTVEVEAGNGKLKTRKVTCMMASKD